VDARLEALGLDHAVRTSLPRRCGTRPSAIFHPPTREIQQFASESSCPLHIILRSAAIPAFAPTARNEGCSATSTSANRCERAVPEFTSPCRHRGPGNCARNPAIREACERSITGPCCRAHQASATRSHCPQTATFNGAKSAVGSAWPVRCWCPGRNRPLAHYRGSGRIP
jgi:hypothetical protein